MSQSGPALGTWDGFSPIPLLNAMLRLGVGETGSGCSQATEECSHSQVTCFGELGEVSVRDVCFIRVLRAGQDPKEPSLGARHRFNR